MEATVLEKVIPKSRNFKFGKDEIEVKKFKLRHIPEVGRLFEKLLPMLGGATTQEDLNKVLFSMLGEHFEQIIKLVTLSTGLGLEDLEAIEEEEPSKFKAILEAVVEVNSDFLDRLTRLVPNLASDNKTTPLVGEA